MIKKQKINKYDDVTVDIIMRFCFQMNMRYNWYLFNGLKHTCEWYQYLMIHMFSSAFKDNQKIRDTQQQHVIP